MRKFLASLAKPLVDALLQPNVSRLHSINEIQKAASVRCHKYVYDYIAGGSDDESALRNNAESFRNKFDAYPFVLNGVGPENVCTKTRILGTVEVDVPFIPAPIAGKRDVSHGRRTSRRESCEEIWNDVRVKYARNDELRRD
jgi:hypothetical protein